MANGKAQPKPDESKNSLKIRITPDVSKGVYSNIIRIRTNKEEVLLDFLLQDDNETGQLVSRVILSKEHTKRLSQTLMKLMDKDK